MALLISLLTRVGIIIPVKWGLEKNLRVLKKISKIWWGPCLYLFFAWFMIWVELFEIEIIVTVGIILDKSWPFVMEVKRNQQQQIETETKKSKHGTCDITQM